MWVQQGRRGACSSPHGLHRSRWQPPAWEQGAELRALRGSPRWHTQQSGTQLSTKGPGMETDAGCHTGTKASGKERGQEAGQAELCKRRVSSTGFWCYIVYMSGWIRDLAVHSKLLEIFGDFGLNWQVFHFSCIKWGSNTSYCYYNWSVLSELWKPHSRIRNLLSKVLYRRFTSQQHCVDTYPCVCYKGRCLSKSNKELQKK